jgi:nucleotide-binding universal stress UspA family protein
MKRILVCLDGSGVEAKVLEAALAHAEAFQARLVLFRAITLPTEVFPAMLDVSPDRVTEVLLNGAREHLGQMAQRVPPARLGGTRIDLGSPWRTICDAARAEDADLVVIGSHGYGGVDRLLGTTAAKVVNHADRNVLVVRP